MAPEHEPISYPMPKLAVGTGSIEIAAKVEVEKNRSVLTGKYLAN